MILAHCDNIWKEGIRKLEFRLARLHRFFSLIFENLSDGLRQKQRLLVVWVN